MIVVGAPAPSSARPASGPVAVSLRVEPACRVTVVRTREGTPATGGPAALCAIDVPASVTVIDPPPRPAPTGKADKTNRIHGRIRVIEIDF
jgi:hypothetical protein